MKVMQKLVLIDRALFKTSSLVVKIGSDLDDSYPRARKHEDVVTEISNGTIEILEQPQIVSESMMPGNRISDPRDLHQGLGT